MTTKCAAKLTNFLFFIFRFIVMRRIFLMMSILYFLRSITMYVTVLPVSSTTYFCSPKLSNSTTPLIIAKRAFQLMSGFGLSINGKHTYCGDYIYSGHTVMLVLGYLTISECKCERGTNSDMEKWSWFYRHYRSAKAFLCFALDCMDECVCWSSDGTSRSWPLHYRCTYRLLYYNTTILGIPYTCQ